MTFILFMLTYPSWNKAFHTVEFNSKQSCEVAIVELQKRKFTSTSERFDMVCIAKGETR